MEQDRLSLRDLQVAANSLGAKRTEKAIEILSDNEVFIQAWKSNVGKEILGYLVERYEQAIVRIARNTDESVCRECRVELAVIEGLVGNLARKVNSYVGTIDRIRSKTKREV